MQNKEVATVENRRIHCDELINFMPYEDKKFWARNKIKEFFLEVQKYNQENPQNGYQEITVSFSGGKDSTVLLDLVLKVHHEMHFDIPIQPCYAAEITFPTTYKFIREIVANYQKKYHSLKDPLILNPKMPWMDILKTKGYPIFSKQVSVLINRTINAKTKNCLCKWFFGIDQLNTSTTKYKLSFKRLFLLDEKMRTNWPKLDSNEARQYFANYNEYYFFSEKCCDFVKGALKHDKRPSFVGTMVAESNLRRKSWIDKGCNIFNNSKMTSRPLSIWKSSDIWKYIKEQDLMVNPAYGYNTEIGLDEQKLRFNRLGCSSCPFGSHIEQKIINYAKDKGLVKSMELRNRFEILKEDYPNIYKSQVIMTGMYKIIMDMGVPIKGDGFYEKLYELRQAQIARWYDSKYIRNNILKLLTQIENYQDYKHKGDSFMWHYTLNEVNQSMKYFGLSPTTKKEFDEIRKVTATKYINPKGKK